MYKQNESIITELRNAIGGVCLFVGNYTNKQQLDDLIKRYYGRGLINVVTGVEELSHMKAAFAEEWVFKVDWGKVNSVSGNEVQFDQQTDYFAVNIVEENDELNGVQLVYTASKLQPDMRNYQHENRAIDIDTAALAKQDAPKIILPS